MIARPPSREPSRREVLGAAAATTALAAGAGVFPFLGASARAAMRRLGRPAPVPQRILFLGGTGFLGPHMVRRALDNGHNVTIFNRGKTNADLFPNVERLVGDRYTDLSALEEGEWDTVIDTFTYVPRTVRATVDLLAPRTKRYVVVSSASVYGQRNDIDMTEDAPLETMPPEEVARIQTHLEVGQYFGAMKALCEKTAEEGMPGRVWSPRPGLIVGPGDPTNRFTYWPARIRRGGEVLAPGEPGHFTQFIDARDLANFIILGAESGLTGPCNVLSPARHFTMGDIMTSSKEASGSDATFTWVPTEFLQSRGVSPWGHMPCWIPPIGAYAGFGQMSAQRAVDAGMTIRPLTDTVRDTLAWVDEQDDEFKQRLDAGLVFGRGGSGMPPAFEAMVLDAWHKENTGG